MNIVGVHLDRKQTLPNATRIVEEIRGMGRQAMFFNMDASNTERISEVVQEIETALAATTEPDAVKILVHSLAFGSLRPYFSTNPDEPPITPRQMESTLHVMAHSLVYWVQALYHKGLLARGSRIFALTSSGSLRVMPSYGAVSAAKCALESHVRQITLEMSHLGITANCIRAGVTDTPALRKIPGNERLLHVAAMRNPGHRLTTPEDVAKSIAIIAAAPDWMAGNIINVDGGEIIAS